jgi:hypothetical protein
MDETGQILQRRADALPAQIIVAILYFLPLNFTYEPQQLSARGYRHGDTIIGCWPSIRGPGIAARRRMRLACSLFNASGPPETVEAKAISFPKMPPSAKTYPPKNPIFV